MKQTFKLGMLSAAIAAGLTGCGTLQLGSEQQHIVDALSSQLNISYDIVTNHGAQEGMACQEMGAEWASCNEITMTVVNDGDAVESNDWKIYLHSIRVILEVANKDFTIEHITGDLYVLTPTESFKGFAAGETIEIPLIQEYWTLFETDFMPRAYVVSGDATPKAIESLNTENVDAFVSEIEGNEYKRVPEDNNILATAASRFAKNSDVEALAEGAIEAAIIPTPLKARQMRGELNVAGGFAITNNALDAAQLAAFEERAELLDVNVKGDVALNINVDAKAFEGEEAVSGAYKLAINAAGVEVLGYDSVGAFYGLQSMLALMSKGDTEVLPWVAIEDAPRFQYRGVMVDVARNFHSKDAILRTVDQMAAYKLNKLHLHLTDDEGWRLEIPGLPELTDVGAERCHDLSETSCLLPQLGSGPDSDNFGSGFFSKADYIEILEHAKARGIEVIPEIDMPAHSRAAVVSMEARYKKYAEQGDLAKAEEFRLMDPMDTSNVTTVQFYDKRSFVNPCMDSSLNFVTKVITEVKAMHEEAGMPLSTWHFGGDEAKNIKLNAGFQDINASEPVAWKGSIDLSQQDKPFAKSPMCQKLIEEGVVSDFGHLPSYFAEKVSGVVSENGIENFQAWQDGLKYSKDASAFETENTRVNFWDVLYWGGDASAYDWAAKGYDLIVSNPDYVYMDMPYEVDPKERGYYWATRATDTRKMFGFAPENLPQNAETSVDRDGNGFNGKGTVDHNEGFYGLSAQLWSETVRTDEQYEYMVFPRVIAAAERAWHKADWELDYQAGKQFNQQTTHVDKDAQLQDWTRFANVMGQREMAKLDASGINYRIPVPGAVMQEGKLHMNISLPGLPLQYSVDGGKSWTDYAAPVAIEDASKVQVRALSADKQREGRAVSL
ncbi:carbohydate-binding domain-containing protein [Enterovibrio sp. ZSDZ35]|uniref:beta-N-acetylhexosaminidase n=1 Tax=Enterovibrio qingdaonensis TaxID=2899818 RepID=A0ABT5QPY9_9GAMM|nr:beta-N-acetylhexosaminidase [Enterovibrio sp. ZSDZ35]MDD1782356.1 carbohydate-binding domain-containing protein [Enterovibrio sp. ZSDZ35]